MTTTEHSIEFPLLQGACVCAGPGVDLAPNSMSWHGTIDGYDVALHWARYASYEGRWSLHLRRDGDHELFQAASAVEAVAAMREALA